MKQFSFFRFLLLVLFIFFFISQTLVFQNTVSSVYQSGVRLDAASSSCKSSFFGLEPWYEFLNTYQTKNNNCNVCFNILPKPNTKPNTKPNNSSNNSSCGSQTNSTALVVMAIIDDLLRVSGVVAVVYIIYAGFEYVTSQGNPEKANKARQSILFALIGLVIAISAIVFVTYIGHSLG